MSAYQRRCACPIKMIKKKITRKDAASVMKCHEEEKKTSDNEQDEVEKYKAWMREREREKVRGGG